MTSVSIAIVHYPVFNKHGEIVTTSVTNFDLHDCARTAKTYGIDTFFVVTPIRKQQNMVRYIYDYWREGIGASFNLDRRAAFENMVVVDNVDQACLTMEKIHAKKPLLIATTARETEKPIYFEQLKGMIREGASPFLLLFGTGWGLSLGASGKTENSFTQVDGILEPIRGNGSYNHLSVRSAVAIVMDRLLAK